MNNPLFTKKQVYNLIIPLIMEQLLMAAVGMFDVIMVSGLGEYAISAVSLVDFINQLINSALTAFSTGGAILCSQYIGKKRAKDAADAVQHLAMLVLILGLGLMAAAFWGNRRILGLLYGSIEPQVMENAQIYFWLSGISYPFIALFCCSAAIMRALGYTRLSFKASLVMNLMNIVMNAIFIFGLGWGVFGAGFASLLSRAAVSVFLFFMVLKGQTILPVPSPLQWRFTRRRAAAVFNLSVPTTLESSMFYIGRLLVQSLVTSFGTSAIAANAVSLTVTEFLHMPGAGAGIGMITIVGQCIGAGEKEQARRYSVYLIRLVYILQGICCVLSMLFASLIGDLYNLTDATKEIAVWMLLTHGVVCTLIWPMGFTTTNALKAAGDVRFTMVMSFAVMWIFRVEGSYFLVWLFPELGVKCVWIAMYCDWLFRAIACFLRFRGEAWLCKGVK